MRSSSIAAGVLAALGLPFVSAWVSPHAHRARLANRQVAASHDVKAPRGALRRSELQYYTNKTSSFYVDGTKIPEVDFNVGESYAGLIPVDASKPEGEQQKNFFWFFPTENPAGKDDVIIWFNGGPGCSSLEGFLQENGPFLWQYGTYKPIPNAWSWHKLANVIWVEYPIGAGFSSGNVTATNNAETADQFVSFWKNLVSTFGLQGKKLYIAGESYAGIYVPYVGAAMLDKNDTSYYNVKGALYYDPVMPYSDDLGLDHAALPAFHRYWENVLGFSNSMKEQIEQDNKKLGLDAYLDKYLSYPPPAAPWPNVQWDPDYDVVNHFDNFINVINPCFNGYHILDQCPVLWDVLGFPSVMYSPPNATLYFNIPEVRKAIHVPVDYPSWSECQDPVFVDGNDNYNGTDHEIKFQTLVERTNNVHIGSGLADYVIQPNVTALGIQRIRWNGKQGFETAPSEELVLPTINNNDDNTISWAGGNVQGTFHTERGFTHSTAKLSGHMVPQYSPGTALRHAEHLLGRVKSLSSGENFTVNISTSFEWPY
ncbi:serine carboxypeptidase [Colletotrichum karsti]|uniref:Carboxypeptidase n=1 Tax=Colletotrichum karsti TaxID=1095194 RepID=A0A9P6I2Q1_9PEZI|nr:serine carboxypeptidase [Colletotrichum karsti]KAF9874657.1 serine carboxypeptidase [Colletotrichum karsti]